MNKNFGPNEQLTLLNKQVNINEHDINEPILLDKAPIKGFENEKEFDVINLREELRNDIPSTTYLTHGIHNFYPAKFIPHVPRFVIKRFEVKNKIILDPFAGSGTTAVESLITGNI